MPNISNMEMHRLEKAEEKLQDLTERMQLASFVEDFKVRLGTLAAYTPMDKWPEEFRAAFDASSQMMPALAALYTERHQRVNA